LSLYYPSRKNDGVNNKNGEKAAQIFWIFL
jgi:hypothetical protein